MIKHNVPYDVWLMILETLEDTRTVAACARVSWLYDAAISVLYRTIHVKHVVGNGPIATVGHKHLILKLS
jgi:hypothetical protein